MFLSHITISVNLCPLPSLSSKISGNRSLGEDLKKKKKKKVVDRMLVNDGICEHFLRMCTHTDTYPHRCIKSFQKCVHTHKQTDRQKESSPLGPVHLLLPPFSCFPRATPQFFIQFSLSKTPLATMFKLTIPATLSIPFDALFSSKYLSPSATIAWFTYLLVFYFPSHSAGR